MTSVEDGATRHAGFIVNDRPDRPLLFERVEQLRAMPPGLARDAAFHAAGVGDAKRAYLGSTVDRGAEQSLRDAQGRKRLVLRVEPGGGAPIDFLDEHGRVVRRTTPAG